MVTVRSSWLLVGVVTVVHNKYKCRRDARCFKIPRCFKVRFLRKWSKFDLESLVHVEQMYICCYENSLQNAKKKRKKVNTDLWSPVSMVRGYHDGFAHRRIHGLIEGRGLGREKGFEMWEELGFYEGLHWPGGRSLDSSRRKTSWVDSDLLSDLFCGSRASQHIRHLLEYIHALTHPVPHLIYQSFYAWFDRDTRHSAQSLAGRPSRTY